jgi:hypothetical protein
MPNLRVISDNAIERATLTASTTASNFALSNLVSGRKSDVWRSTATSARLGATWAAAEAVQGVALPFCNLSPTATVRVRATSEPAVTNLFTYSEQMDNAAWTKTRSTVPATNSTAPDGTTTADTLQGDGTGSSYAYQSKTLSSAGTYPVSVFVKAGTYAGSFSIRDLTDGGIVSVDLTTLAVSASGNFSSPKLTALANGWYRLSATITPLTTGSKDISIFNANTTGNVLVWGVMLGSGSGALTSYYPSVASPGVRPLGYIDSWQSYSYDSGNVLACPVPAVTLRGFTAAQAASAYAFGGGATARHWMPAAIQAYGLAVDIVDTGNLQGYIEAAFLLAGPYWEAATNFDYGASAQLIDSTKSERSDAGDLVSDAGTISKKLSLPFSKLSPTDRATLWSILRANGSRYPVFVSMFPGSSDLALERDHQVYGKLVQLPAMSLPFFNLASATVEIESI